jgi:hypothetical protein
LSAATGNPGLAAPLDGRFYVTAQARRLLDVLVAVWIASGALVFIEPSPYEVAFLGVLGVSLAAGLGLYRSTLGLLFIFVGFVPFGLISSFQAQITPLSEGLIFVVVTYFLLLTSYFVANYVLDAPVRRMRLIVAAYTLAAVVSAIIGSLAYFGLIPGSDQFLLYGRARAMFKDPNVYGPFLMLPAAYALQRVLLTRGWGMLFAGAIYGILLVGVFASFSRAAWGHLAGTSALVVLLVFFIEANVREKLRIIIVSMAGLASVIVLLAGLLSIPAVASLFEVRTVTQNYDAGETGRFGRQGFAFELAFTHPLGLGPQEFSNGPIREEPHNTYVNVLLNYGWGGGGLYWLMIAWTSWLAIAGLLRAGPMRLVMIPLASTWFMLIGEAAIIDTDHWRHFFLLTGLIWGVSKARMPAGTDRRAFLRRSG